jgi:DNA-binding NarL/FixJ family response regulator
LAKLIYEEIIFQQTQIPSIIGWSSFKFLNRRTVPHRILIADDSPQVRTGIRRMIERHEDWEICGEAKDGHEALLKTYELCPDVIVLDFFMPATNGIVVAREIAEKCPKTAVVLCSMYLDSQLAGLAREAGIAGILSKSNAGQIVNCIETVLRGEKFYASSI